MDKTSTQESAGRVLHAVVGCKLPVCFENCVRSIRALAPGDDLLVVDNDSRLPGLTEIFSTMAHADPRVSLITRSANDLTNQKVGGLYDAYREITDHALAAGYDFLHLMQGDMQMLWWDRSVVAQARSIFHANPSCVQIFTLATPGLWERGDDLEFRPDRSVRIAKFGLCDVGFIHLERWRENEMAWTNSETDHGSEYLRRGFSIICHPWPTTAQIPWPAVVRNGRQRGREVPLSEEFLLRPLDEQEIAQLKMTERHVWLEDVCVPWGWQCLTPLWITDLSRHYYWMFTLRDLRARGRAALPRWNRRGLPDGSEVGAERRRPALWKLWLNPPAGELRWFLRSLRQGRLRQRCQTFVSPSSKTVS